MMDRWRPGPQELAAAYGRSIPDVIAPDLRALFCGINPSLYSGAVGHHFAGPTNRFWKSLRGADFTDRILSAFENHELLQDGFGVTNLVNRATRSAKEVSRAELREGVRILDGKVKRYRPTWVAVVGVEAYRKAFAQPGAGTGLQPEALVGVRVWVLPNPSGLNTHYPLPALIEEFRQLREAIEADEREP